MKTLKRMLSSVLALALVLSMTGMVAFAAGDISNVDKTALADAIAEAVANVLDTDVSPDGSDVLPSDKWVTNEVLEAYEIKILKAKDIETKVDATQAEVDAALAELTAATVAFNNAKRYGLEDPDASHVDKTGLIEEITLAENQLNSNHQSEDGQDIYQGEPWTPAAVRDTYQSAIDAALSVVDNEEATQQEVNEVLTALKNASQVFKAAIKDGLKPSSDDRRALNSAVGDAARNANATRVSADGTDVLVGTYWVTATVKDAYRTEIDAAYDIYHDTSLTDEDYVVAKNTLVAATDAFNLAKQPGTKAPPTSTPSESAPSPSENVANSPATAEKVEKTVEAVAELGDVNLESATLPAGVKAETTASGNKVAAVPVQLFAGSADLNLNIINTIGGNNKVALELNVSQGISGGGAKILLPGGFGKITEPGRLGYSFDFKAKSKYEDEMLGAIKGTDATSVTVQVGGNHTLPVEATITTSCKAPEGTVMNIYNYNPYTGKFVSIGSAKVVGGKLTFNTAALGQLLFTTGTI